MEQMTNDPNLAADPDLWEKTFRALRMTQPIGDIYLASVNFTLIQEITHFDVRRVLQKERDVEKYLGIQRPLHKKRVDDLKKYVNFLDATFPTSIIVAIDNADYVEFDEDSSELRLSNCRKGEDKPSLFKANLCRVIDGQHRIAGLEGFKGNDFDVAVAFFIGSDIADQAYVFATVNLEQTKVNRSLALDLYSLARTRSPFKTCHNITVALDSKKSSPFYQRIKRLGVATEGRTGEMLTQSTVVNAILKYISDDPKVDRDLLLRGGKLEKVTEDSARKLCFRNLFVDEEDVKIGKIVEEYFDAVRERWPEAWAYRGTGRMLNRTNGFRALMSVFGRVYNYLAAPGDYVPSNEFAKIFQKVNANDTYFSTELFKPGSSGEAELRRFFLREMFE